jgi:hypothetical protein
MAMPTSSPRIALSLRPYGRAGRSNDMHKGMEERHKGMNKQAKPEKEDPKKPEAEEHKH